MGDEAYGVEEPKRPARRRGVSFTWLGLIALGFLIYETTSQPALGAAAVCVKFGLEHFLTARWLRKIDHNRMRAAANFWLYLSAGLWRITIVAFIMTHPLLILSEAVRQNGAQPPKGPPFEGALIVMKTWVLGSVVSALATVRAIWLGWRAGISIWLGDDIRRARRWNIWPGHIARFGATNHLGRVLLPSMIVLYMLCFVAFFVCFDPGEWNVALVVSIFLISLFVVPVFFLILREVLIRRFVAPSPFAAWPDEPLEDETSMRFAT